MDREVDRKVESSHMEIGYNVSPLEVAAMIIGECTSEPALKLALRSFDQWRNRACQMMPRKPGMPIEGPPSESPSGPLEISYEWGPFYEVDLREPIEMRAKVKQPNPQRGPIRNWRHAAVIIITVTLALLVVDHLVMPDYRSGVAMGLGALLATWFIRRA